MYIRRPNRAGAAPWCCLHGVQAAVVGLQECSNWSVPSTVPERRWSGAKQPLSNRKSALTNHDRRAQGALKERQDLVRPHDIPPQPQSQAPPAH